MVLYVALCKNLEEAEDVQNKLIGRTPTLVFSRVLKHVRELDSYDRAVFTSMDAQAVVGQLAFGQGFRSEKKVRRGLLLRMLAVLAGVATCIALELLTLGPPFRSPRALLFAIVVLMLGTLLLLLSAMWASAQRTPAGVAFVHAADWLGRGFPVTLAGSDDPPGPDTRLPANVIFFEVPVPDLSATGT